MNEFYFHVDGDLVPAESASVNVRDRGFMYGDAAFETLRVYGGRPFEWSAHARRLQRTCDRLGYGDAIPPADDLRERVEETLEANELDEASVKLSVTRGVQPGKLTPNEVVEPTVVVTVSELPPGGSTGEQVWDGPARVKTVSTRRIPTSAVPSSLKTHNYLNGIFARLELRNSEYDEAIMQDIQGRLTEGATSNLFFVDVGTLKTPAPELALLPGITASVVLDLAESAGIPIETGAFEPAVLRRSSEVFLTNSTWEIRPVTVVNDVDFEVGPVTETLQSAFDDRIDEFTEEVQ